MNILIFVKSNSKLHFFGPLSRYVRTLIINISSSKVPTNKVHIHSVRNVCKLDIIFHLSWQDLSRNVDHPFKNSTQRVRVQTNGADRAELKYSIHLAPFISRMRRQNAHMLEHQSRFQSPRAFWSAPSLGADQKARGLWERDCSSTRHSRMILYCTGAEWGRVIWAVTNAKRDAWMFSPSLRSREEGAIYINFCRVLRPWKSLEERKFCSVEWAIERSLYRLLR